MALNKDKAGQLAQLRARIRTITPHGRSARGEPVPLALGPVDDGLPGGGLARVGMHEIADAALGTPIDGPEAGAATGFAAWVAGRCVAVRRAGDGPAGAPAALWIAGADDLYPPGLIRFGLAPADLVQVRAQRRQDRLWALEEALRSGAVAVAVAELDPIDLTAARRLQLAAEAGGTAGVLLHRARAGRPVILPASPALTRWRVAAAPGTAVGAAVGVGVGVGVEGWRLDLVRCRDGRPRSWVVAWGRDAPAGPAWSREGGALIPAPDTRAVSRTRAGAQRNGTRAA